MASRTGDAPVYDTRLPRHGVLRKYMLLPEHKKAGVIAMTTVLIIVGITWLFSGPSSRLAEPPVVRHSMTADEKLALTQQIREEERAKFEQQLADERQAALVEINGLEQELDAEMNKGGDNHDKVDELQQKLNELRTKQTQAETKKRDEFEAGLSAIVASKLAAMQKRLIEDGASKVLDWFCHLSSADGEVSPGSEAVSSFFEDVTTSPVYLDSHRCVGVAHEDDESVNPSLYMARSGSLARDVAEEAIQSLRKYNDRLLGFSIARAAYNESDDAYCEACSTVLFAVHPVLGVFYKLKLAMLPDDAAPAKSGTSSLIDQPVQDGTGDVSFRPVCYRRRWIPKPIVTPMTPSSQIIHLLKPELLPKLPSSARRQLYNNAHTRLLSDSHQSGPRETSSVGGQSARLTTNFILPFRARHLDAFPHLLRSLELADRVRRFRPASRDQPLVRLIVVPLSGEMVKTDRLGVQQRLRDAIHAANETIHYNITLADPLPADKMTATHVLQLTRGWVDATLHARGKQSAPPSKSTEELREELVASIEGWEKSVKKPSKAKSSRRILTVPPKRDLRDMRLHVLPNRWLAAILGGLGHISAGRSVVFVLDSSTSSVSGSLAKKTLWRVIEGHQVFSPVMYSLTSLQNDDALAAAIQDDGGITLADEDVERAAEDAFESKQVPDKSSFQLPFQLASFYEPDPDAVGGRRLALRGGGKGGTVSGGARMAAAEGGADPSDPNEGEDDPSGGDLGGQPAFSTSERDDPLDGLDPEDRPAHDGKSLVDDDEWNDDAAAGHAVELQSEDDDMPSLPLSEAQWDRYTALGITKVDLAAAIYRVVKSSVPLSSTRALAQASSTAEDSVPELGDQCLLRRILSVLRQKGYRIVRTPGAGLRVKTFSSFAADMPDEPPRVSPELGPCDCDDASSGEQNHCRLFLPLQDVDDPSDKERVLCAVAQMSAAIDDAIKQRKATKTRALAAGEEGARLTEPDDVFDYEYRKTVDVHHPVRYFDASEGLEIVAKVTPVISETEAGAPAYLPATAEVFSFRWKLTDKAVEVDGNHDDRSNSAGSRS